MTEDVDLADDGLEVLRLVVEKSDPFHRVHDDAVGLRVAGND